MAGAPGWSAAPGPVRLSPASRPSPKDPPPPPHPLTHPPTHSAFGEGPQPHTPPLPERAAPGRPTQQRRHRASLHRTSLAMSRRLAMVRGARGERGGRPAIGTQPGGPDRGGGAAGPCSCRGAETRCRGAGRQYSVRGARMPTAGRAASRAPVRRFRFRFPDGDRTARRRVPKGETARSGA